jgi:hypothetical protein
MSVKSKISDVIFVKDLMLMGFLLNNDDNLNSFFMNKSYMITQLNYSA